MRQDQFERLQSLEEKLLDVFLTEAEPSEWPGAGIKIAAMDAQTRGDLYWVRKTAASVLMLATRVQHMIGQTQLAGAGTTPPIDPDADANKQMDAELASAEREAMKLMQELTGGGKKKKAFDRKVHGS